MIRTVLLVAALAVVGGLLGFLLIGSGGGVFGVCFGALAGVLWIQGRRSTREVAVGEAVHHETVRVLCVPTGQFADVEMTHDGHHWCDVESCSLCHPHDEVQCRKRCVELMNDSALPPREAQLAI
ncbi:MAG: hypothetical protein U1F36_06325 [Planctomycetota bacterium]